MERKIVSGIMLILLLASVLTLALSIQPVKTQPTTIIVPDDYPTIQEAINNASEGDTILVRSGTYYENVIINKSISLLGENRDTTIVDGSNKGHVVLVNSNNVTIAGFTIENSGPLDGCGVLLQSVRDNTIYGNLFRWDVYGILLSSSANNVVSDNFFPFSRTGGRGVGWNIELDGSDNNTIIRNNISNDANLGINFMFSGGNSIIGNSITNQTLYGMILQYSGGNILRDNSMTGNCYNFYVWADFAAPLSDFINDIDSSNMVDGRKIYYFVNTSNVVIDPGSFPDAGFLALVNSTQISVRDLTLQRNGVGLLFAFTKDSQVQNVTLLNNDLGFHLCHTSNILFTSSRMQHNDDGVLLDAGERVVIHNNDISNNDIGISITGVTRNNSIVGNNIINNGVGTVFCCVDSNYNTIYHNNFINNTSNVGSLGQTNSWDESYPCGGNYWSDYNGTDLYGGPFQNIPGSDEIGDTPYVIDASNQDNYPLTRPYVPFDNQTIYIRADGSVDPSGAPVQRKGDLYTLTDNITSSSDGIVIERDNMTLDGVGHTIQGTLTAFDVGINAGIQTNLTIKNMEIRAFGYGIIGSGAGSSLSDSILSNSIVGSIWAGVLLGGPGYNTVSENNITAGSNYGIWLNASPGNNITGNNIDGNNLYGIRLTPSCDNNYVSGNNIMDNDYGIVFGWHCSDNTIADNNIINNDGGIALTESSSGNSIYGNNISGCTDNFGIVVSSASSNRIFHNNLSNNTNQVSCQNSLNSWDDGYPSGGNYWSDYAGQDSYSGPYQNETGSDGIGDTPYIIDANNTDNYPLTIADVAISNITLAKTVVGQRYGVSVNATLQNGVYEETFNVTVYANAAAINETRITLTSRNSSTITLTWDTTGFAFGNYTLNACAWPVPGEVKIENNKCTCDIPIHVGVPGDMSGTAPGVYDGIVNMKDIAYLVSLYQTKLNKPNWNPNADVNNDGVVDMKDIAIAVYYFNQHE